MNADARARANIARPGKRQTLAGLDPYHRLLRETREQPGLPYTAAQASFSVPRPSPSTRTDEEPLPTASSRTNGRLASSIDDETFSADTPRLQTPAKAATFRRVNVPQPVTLSQTLSQSFTKTDPQPTEVDDAVNVKLSWRPFFLYRRILIALAACFFSLIVIIEFLLTLSDKRDGLFDATLALRHIWQYGLVLISVVLAAIWGRVEFQAKASAPWIRLSKGFAKAEKSLLLDYLSMAQPLALFRACQNGDVVVIGTTFISMVLLGLVFVAATLVTPFIVPTVLINAPITIRSTFVGDPSALQDIGNWPYVNMLELQTTSLRPPAGVSRQFAFQTFDASYNMPTLLNATVDGFTSGLRCQEANVTLTGIKKASNLEVLLNVSVTVPGCSTSQGLLLTKTIAPDQEALQKQVVALQPGSCGGSTLLNDQRIVIVSGSLRVDPGAVESIGRSTKALVGIGLTSSMGMVCQLDYAIAPLQVVQNQTGLISQPSIVLDGAPSRALSNVHPWEIAEAHFASFEDRPPGLGFFGILPQLSVGQSVMDIDEPTAAMIATHMKASGEVPRFSGFQDPVVMNGMAQEYFRQYSALIASSGLMRSASIPSTAIAIIMRQRMIMHSLPSHVAAAMLGFCGIGALVLCLLVPKKGFLPRNPASIAAVASLVANSSGLLQTLRGTGGLDMDSVREKLEQKVYYVDVQDAEPTEKSAMPSFRIRGGKGMSYQPYVFGTRSSTPWERPLMLRWLIRLLGSLAIFVLIILLEAGLRASSLGNGYALITQTRNNIQHLVCMLLPMFIMLPLVDYLLLTDFYTRATAPFLRLLSGADFEESLGLNLLDTTRVVALRRALLTRNYFVVLTVLAALVAPLLFVVSAGLVTTLPVDMWKNVSTASAMPLIDVSIHQDMISTRILQGLLGLLLILLSLSWYSSKDTGGLPRPTTSIASIVAYLVDGNVIEALPNNAEWMPLSRIQDELRKGYAVMYASMSWETTIQTSRGRWTRPVDLFGARITRWGGASMLVSQEPLAA